MKNCLQVAYLCIFIFIFGALNPAFLYSQSLNNKLQPLFSVGGIEYPDAEINFSRAYELRFAGDVNGNGKSDFFYQVLTADETTEKLSDRTIKSELYLGSEGGLDKSELLMFRDTGEFVFVGDITGNGISDGIGVSPEGFFLIHDESGGNMEQFTEFELLLHEQFNYFHESFSSYSTYLNIQSYGDYTGNSQNDVIIYNSQSIPNDENHFFIVQAVDNNNINELEVTRLTYMPDGESMYEFDKILYGDVNNDGKMEILRVSSQSQNSDGGSITVYHEDDSGNLEVQSQSYLSPNFIPFDFLMRDGKIDIVDLNGNENKELILMVNDHVYIFELSDEEGEYYTEETFINRVFFGTEFYVIGDYNNDGFADLLIENEGEIQLLRGDASLNLLSQPLPGEPEEELGLIQTSQSQYMDLNGSGINDIVIRFVNYESGEYGYRVYFGNPSGDLTISSEISFQDFEYDIAHYTLNTGDINGNGVEDFAIVYNETIEIYFGGEITSEPDLIIDPPGKTHLGSPAVGDFTGNGYSDLVVNVLDDAGGGLYFYFGGAEFNNEADHIILFSSLVPEFDPGASRGFTSLENIGDINGNGMDDLLFSSPSSPDRKSFILFGNPTLSHMPDIEIPFASTNILRLGDFNQNGHNDFAIWFYSAQENIRIFTGFSENEGESLSDQPAQIIEPPVREDGHVMFWGATMAAGDLTGDGVHELIISPTIHVDHEGEGVEVIYIYKGGSDLSDTADHSFIVNKEPFRNADDLSENKNLERSVGELTVIPDIDGDGTDELLFGMTTAVNFSHTNAAIFLGKPDIFDIGSQIDLILNAPNQASGLSSNNNYIYSQNAHSAVGDFNGNGLINIVIPQSDDFNFIRDKVYFYEVELSVDIEYTDTVVKEYFLEQNYPNPFNPVTVIGYQLPVTSVVSLDVYNILGRRVATLVNEQKAPGRYEVSFDASGLSSGIYIYRITTGEFVETRKLMLVK